MLSSMEYLGHYVSQLRSFSGVVTYYFMFLPQLSSTLATLYRLLEKWKEWLWNAVEEEAFAADKE